MFAIFIVIPISLLSAEAAAFDVARNPAFYS
jgi:hypothetical protein